MPPVTPGLPGAGAETGHRTLVRAWGRSGEVVVRETGTGIELIVNGVFLMDTRRGGASERLLAREVIAACPAPDPACLVGGLGFGYTVAEILTASPSAYVTCVELEAAVIDSVPLLAAAGAPAGLARDRRVRLVHGDVLRWAAAGAARYDAVMLDVDNGPSWLVRPQNRRIYSGRGVAALAAALRPGGVLGVWSAQPEPAFAGRLAQRFRHVREVAVPAERGAPDVIYLASR